MRGQTVLDFTPSITPMLSLSENVWPTIIHKIQNEKHAVTVVTELGETDECLAGKLNNDQQTV